jgi:3-oxoacyl-[acyl-carrier-protein] synthase III
VSGGLQARTKKHRTSPLAAAKAALDQAGVAANEVDPVIVATATPDKTLLSLGN